MRHFAHFILLGLLATSAAFAHPPHLTLPVDPLELIDGRESPGKPDLAIVHEGIEYRFISEDNKSAFEKDPAKYRVADGGACGRMGPLSGIGDARRYAVHDNRIYFFSSDSCRAGFLKDPAIHIETQDEKIFGSNDQVLAGRAILDKCLAWAGGAERIRALTSYRDFAERVEVAGGQEYRVTNETVIAFPSSYYQKEAWGPSWFSTSSSKDGGSTANKTRKQRIADDIERGFIRRMARYPVVILKAHADGGGTGGPAADCPGLIVVADGAGDLNGAPVEYVKVWLNGATSRLTIDKATGKLLQLAYRGRDGSSMPIGDSIRTYTTYATVEGVTLPTAYTVTFNAKDLPAAAAKVDQFEVNQKPEADLFTAPGW